MKVKGKRLDLVPSSHGRAIRGGKLESFADILHGEWAVSDKVDLGAGVHQDPEGFGGPIGGGHRKVELELEALPRAPHLRNEQT